MKKSIFIFKSTKKNNKQIIVGIDTKKKSYQRIFDTSNIKKTATSLGQIQLEQAAKGSIVINIQDDNIDGSKLTQLHYHRMAELYNETLDVPAGCEFQMAYVAYAISVLFPDEWLLSNQCIDRFGHTFESGEVLTVDNVEDGRLKRRKFIEEEDVGSSTDLGGEVFKNGVIVGSYSYNGRLFSHVGYGGQDRGIELTDFL
jgi:hypothetical protein